MNKISIVAIAVASTLTAGTLSAASIDYRYEYRAATDYRKNGADQDTHVDARHQHRVKIGESFKINDDWKHSSSLEIKFHEDSTYVDDDGNIKPANSGSFYNGNWYIYGMELDNTATYKVDNHWSLQVGMPIAWDWDEPNAHEGDWKLKKITYKPQLRVIYKSDFGLTTGLRYRHEINDFRNHDTDGLAFGDKDSETGERLATAQKSKITYTGSYKIEQYPKVDLSWEANYVKSHNNVLLYDDKDWEWDAGIKLGYKFESWKPYVELWSSDISSSSSDREAKYRFGVTYSF